jgi:hypothetical protein
VAVGIQNQAFLPVNKRYRKALVSGHISLLRTNTDAHASTKKEIRYLNAGPTYQKSRRKAKRSVYHLAVMSDVISVYANRGYLTSGGCGGGGGGAGELGGGFTILTPTNHK